MRAKFGRWGIAGAVIVILVLTVLEFPAPLGFETRPQDNVSAGWLLLFLAILVSEIAALVLVFRRAALAARFAIAAGALNIVQIVADQFHLMQPEVAPLAYSLLEFSVGVVSIALIYFAWSLLRRTSVAQTATG